MDTFSGSYVQVTFISISWLCRSFGWLGRLRLYRLHRLLYWLCCNFDLLLNRRGSSLYRCRCFSGGFLYCCCFGLLWRNMAHNLAVQRVYTFSPRLMLARHIILNQRTVLFRNIINIAIPVHSSRMTHHHYLFLAAVLVADSQLHADGIFCWRTCHTSVCSCLWLCRCFGLSCCWLIYDAMTLTVVCHSFLVSDALQL